MKSFKCFKDSSTDLLSLYSKLQLVYFAHLSHDKQQKESLFAHSKLVSDYCIKVIDTHGLEKIIDSLIIRLVRILPIENQEDWGNLFKKAFIGAIVYHDLGKVNPNFQLLKMENVLFGENKSLSIQSNHSLLGAYLYANILFKKIFENEKFKKAENEKLLLYFIVLLFSSAIAKHHRPTINVSLDFDERQIDDCYIFLKT